MNAKYYLAVMSAFIIWGLFSLPLKAIENYASLDILLSRVLMASVLILAISLLFRRKISLENLRIFKNLNPQNRRKLIFLNLVSSILLAINWYLFIYVMNRISVNATSLAYMLCPIITTVLAYIILKDRLSKVQWIAVLLSLMSCILLSIGHFMDVFYSFIIALSYAIYLILQKKNQQLDRFFTLTFQIVCGTIILLPLYSQQQELPEKGAYFYGIVFLIAGVFTILPMFLNVFSLNKLNSSTAGIFIYMNPVFSFLLALLYFKEEMDSVKIIAYSVVFFSVILFNLPLISQLIRPKKSLTN
ncbi:EamA family transporter [Moheibacter lacus]|uniref:EamA family transporter n=1 Tax=Moheibacter lacus TaxID=2745851 RepID=A0A838ZU21_9FLAO|nr:EamA family transporter [Moheibacter lacus]MBA5630461.1 EamA family transporter [Moheibacter lacus]